MRYRILKSGKGIIQTRSESFERGEIIFTFENAPKNATAIFTLQGGVSLYRDLEDGECRMRTTSLYGCGEVTVAVLADKTPSEKWECEGFCAIRQGDGSVLIKPDDNDLPGRLSELAAALDDEVRRSEKLEERVITLEREFKRIKQGYNLI